MKTFCGSSITDAYKHVSVPTNFGLDAHVCSHYFKALAFTRECFTIGNPYTRIVVPYCPQIR